MKHKTEAGEQLHPEDKEEAFSTCMPDPPWGKRDEERIETHSDLDSSCGE